MIANLKPYATYKDPGVPWLGEVPEHWEVRRAKSFLREVDQRSRFGEEELLSVSHMTGVTPRREKNVTMFVAESNAGHKLCRPGDVVVNTMWAWMGALGVSKHQGLVSPSYGVYRPLRSADFLSSYLDELLRTPAYQSEYVARSTGITSSRLRLYPDTLLRIPFPCPPADEQAAIVRFLDWADRRIRRVIRARQRRIRLLEEYKQALIHRAVTGHVDVRTGQPYPAYKSLSMERLDKVPEHWHVARLKTLLVRIDQGVSPQAENCPATDGDWGVLKAGCVNHGVFRETQHKRLPFGYIFDEALAVRPGDLLVSRASGSQDLVGSAGLVHNIEARLILSDKLFRLVLRPCIDPEFMAFAMNSPYYRRQVEVAISGAEGLANNLPLSSLRGFTFAVPPPDEALRVVDYLLVRTKQVDASIAAGRLEMDLLKEFRTRLVADVVTGKLDVREVAANLSDEPAEIDAETVEEEVAEEGEESCEDQQLVALSEEVEA